MGWVQESGFGYHQESHDLPVCMSAASKSGCHPETLPDSKSEKLCASAGLTSGPGAVAHPSPCLELWVSLGAGGLGRAPGAHSLGQDAHSVSAGAQEGLSQPRHSLPGPSCLLSHMAMEAPLLSLGEPSSSKCFALGPARVQCCRKNSSDC